MREKNMRKKVEKIYEYLCYYTPDSNYIQFCTLLATDYKNIDGNCINQYGKVLKFNEKGFTEKPILELTTEDAITDRTNPNDDRKVFFIRLYGKDIDGMEYAKEILIKHLLDCIYFSNNIRAYNEDETLKKFNFESYKKME